MIRRYDVVVVGGGMVGLAFALALAREGRRVGVIEAREPPAFAANDPYDLRVIAVNRAAQNLLTRLGAWTQLHAWRVSPYQHMVVWDAAGGGKIQFSAADLGEPNLGHIVENRLLQLALLQAARAQPGFDWLCPAALQSFAADGKEVIVTLSDGRHLIAPVLVGADGAQSQVRAHAGIEQRLTDYGQRAIVCIARTEAPNQQTAWQRFLPYGVLAFLPLQNDLSSIVWSVEDERVDGLLALGDEDFAVALTEAFDTRLGRVTEVGPRAAFSLRARHAERYIANRVALIGDAAHTIHPLAGQGANLGFLDAATLAETLLGTRRDAGSRLVLRRYERARAGENVLMQRAMEGFKWLFGTQVQPLPWVRNTGLNLVDRAAPLKHALMRQAMGLQGELPALARPVVAQN
ncbi:MAG: UbiH/UbiF/VisC/COQ6 family ubiquinone biosynthesis hydroxylase [Thiotrichales bacterium]